MKRLLTDTIHQFTSRERKSLYFSLTMMHQYINGGFRNFDVQNILEKFGDSKEFSSYTLDKDSDMLDIIKGVFNKTFSDFGHKRDGIFTGFIDTRVPIEEDEDLRCVVVPKSWEADVEVINKKTGEKKIVKKKVKPNIEHICYNSLAFDYIMQKIKLKQLVFEFNDNGDVIGVKEGNALLEQMLPLLISTTIVPSNVNSDLRNIVERMKRNFSQFDSEINFDKFYEAIFNAEHYKEAGVEFYDKIFNYREKGKNKIIPAFPEVLQRGLENFSELMTNKKPKKLKINNPLKKFTDE